MVDADALNILSEQAGWASRLPPKCVLTPHPGEMGRLTGLSVTEVNAERIALARRFAAGWGHVVLLKGAYTVIAEPDGRTAVLPLAVPALATAGSGDVLAGSIVSLLAQGLSSYDAAVLGAYLHALAGTFLSGGSPETCLVAGDLLAALPRVRRTLAESS